MKLNIQRECDGNSPDCFSVYDKKWQQYYDETAGETVTAKWFCPYGQPGDVLWVRETWNERNQRALDMGFERYYYKAGWKGCTDGGWKPSIHMPKEACRLFLRITNVRVERLHDVTQQDALSEGIKAGETINHPMTGSKIQSYKNYLSGEFKWMSPVLSFKTLWSKINGAESWNANPWVWVIEFVQITKQEANGCD